MTSNGWSADAFLDSPDAPNSANLLLRIGVPLGILVAMLGSNTNWAYFPDLKWAGLALLASCCLIDLSSKLWTSGFRLFDRVDAAVLLLISWVALSLTWSPDKLGGFDTLIKFALYGVVFVCLRKTVDEKVKIFSACALVTSGVLIVIADMFGVARWVGYGNPNYLTEAVLVAIPAAMFLGKIANSRLLAWGGRIASVFLLGYLLIFNTSKIEFFVIPAMLLAGTLLLLRSKRSKLIAAFGIVGFVSALAVYGWLFGYGNYAHSLRVSLLSRAEFSFNTVAMWLDRPLIGNGAGGFSALYPEFQNRHRTILADDVDVGLAVNQMLYFDTAHNEYAQFLAVFGLFGLIFAVAALTLAARRAESPATDPIRLTGLLVVAGASANMLIDYPLQLVSTALPITVFLAWLLSVAPGVGVKSCLPTDTVAPPSFAARAITICLGLLAILPPYWMSRLWDAQDAFTTSLRFRNVDPGVSVKWAIRAVDAYPFSGFNRAEMTIALMKWNWKARGPVLSPQEQDRIFFASFSAGLNNFTTISRLEYIYNSGRADELRTETDRLRTHLKQNVQQVPGTWLMDALYAAREGNVSLAESSLARYLALVGDRAETVVVDLIRQELEFQSNPARRPDAVRTQKESAKPR